MSSDTSILTHPLSQGIYYLLLTTIPFYKWRQAFPGIPLDWILAFILLVIILIHLLSIKRFPEVFFHNLNIWFILFFLVNLIASLLSDFRSETLGELMVLIQAYGFIVINIFFLTKRAVVRNVSLVLGLSVGLNSLIASLGYFFGMEFLNTYDGKFYTIGAAIGANGLAITCVFIIPLLFYSMLRAKSGPAFFLYAGLILVNVGGIISSESRGGFLHLIIVIVLLLFLNRHRFQPKFFGIAISLLALIIVIGGIAIPDDYFERQSLLVAEEKDTSLLRRAAYIRVAIDSFFENPILGTGTGTFPKIWIQSREAMFFRMVERPTHNVYLQVLVDTGLIGFLIYLGLLFQVFKDILRSIQNYALKGIQRLEEIGISYLICFLVVSSYGLIRNTLDDKLFLLIISLSQVFYFISNSEQQLKDDSDL